MSAYQSQPDRPHDDKGGGKKKESLWEGILAVGGLIFALVFIVYEIIHIDLMGDIVLPLAELVGMLILVVLLILSIKAIEQSSLKSEQPTLGCLVQVLVFIAFLVLMARLVTLFHH